MIWFFFFLNVLVRKYKRKPSYADVNIYYIDFMSLSFLQSCICVQIKNKTAFRIDPNGNAYLFFFNKTEF